MNEPIHDALGLKLDTTPPLDYPPAICIYGPPGAGKSTELGLAFPKCLYIQTAKTVLQPLESFIRWAQSPKTTDAQLTAAGVDPARRSTLALPAKVTLPKYVPGTHDPFDPRPALEKITRQYIEASARGTNPYEGIIFDEWSEMAQRIQTAIDKDPAFGNDGFRRIKILKELHYQLAEIPRATNTMLGLVCHEMEPVYDMDEKSPTLGQLKYRGGPKMPIKTLTHEVASAMDVVLRIVVKKPFSPTDPIQRSYITELQPDWICKIRTWGMKPREPLGLRDLLVRGGYKLS